jgi:hypothetical protein
MIDAWSPESQITVSPDAADVGLVAGGEDEGVLVLHPVGDLALELKVQRQRAVHEAGSGQAGAVALERVAGGCLDARVAGQAQVVVRPERDALLALHLHHRAGLGVDPAEVRQQVVLARRPQLLEPVVRAGLLEDVGGDLHSIRVPLAWPSR